MTADPFAHSEPDGPPSAGDNSPPSPPAGAPSAAEAATAELDQRLLRAMADLDNLRKRFQREVMREREAERSRVAAEWLPIIDDLDRPTSLSFIGDTAFIVTLGGDVLVVDDVAPDRHGMWGGCGPKGHG